MLGSKDLRWSISPYDAWMTRSMGQAAMVNRVIGGEIMLFNPVARQIRAARVEELGTCNDLEQVEGTEK